MTTKKRLGLIYGGRSAEHAVSLASAASVIQNLNSQLYEVIPIFITPSGNWLWDVAPDLILSTGLTPELESNAVTLVTSPLTKGMVEIKPGRGLSADRTLDILLPILHGTNGEDGTIQGLFEMANLPYVGCGVLASAIGMDKVIMKQLLKQAGLPTINFLAYRRHQWEQDSEAVLAEIEAQVGYPCFIKPANLGSSIGVNKAEDRQHLTQAIQLALNYDRKIVVERGLTCREFSCAILGNNDPQASVVGEILPGSIFSDYNDKYINHTIHFVIPAALPPAILEHLRTLAIQAYQTLDLSGLARVDFFLDTVNEQFYLNEVNTMPGFTAQSLYPQLWEASGLHYSSLLDRLLELAEERFDENQQRTWTLS